LAEPLARRPGRELIIARLLADSSDLQRSASLLNLRRASLGVPARSATFTTVEPAQDVTRLARSYDVELVLLDGPPDVEATPLAAPRAGILDRSPADVAVLVGSPAVPLTGGVFVPFGGSDHDWAALELAACLSSRTGCPLKLVGAGADTRRDRRDASRLLA